MNIVRRLVSGQKKRFQQGPDGFDLDLAYIAPRVIAMGLPAVQGKEVLYRNPMPEIARFLQTYHSGHAKVYNLCSEHTYSAQHLSVAVQQYPYDDHQTPPLAMVQQFCADAAAWLAADPVNVVVVHCKAGKGRTGIMICSLLLYLHKNAPDLPNLALPTAGSVSTHSAGTPAQEQQQQQYKAAGAGGGQASSRLWHPWQHVEPLQLTHLEQPVRDILDLYAERRTHDGNGVTIKSQRRYVGYFWAVLCSGAGPEGSLPSSRSVQLRQVTISGLPAGAADSCELLVEARPSGSLAPRATQVCLRSAPRAALNAGLCMVPCAHAPLVQDDSCCEVSTGPQGDTLTFRMPAASMGLSTLQQNSSRAAAAAGAGGCCMHCGASATACACFHSSGALPGAVPAAAPGSQQAAVSGGGGGPAAALAADDCCDAWERAGCCVVEGDVRLVLRRGTTKLCYTWFNTAFLPAGGVYTLTRAQLDKPSKTLPHHLTVTVRFVDMQPTVDGEEALSALGEQQPGQQALLKPQQQKWPPPWGLFEDPPLETSNRGAAQQQGKGKGGAKQQPQQKQKALSLFAEAAVPSGQGLISTAADSQPGAFHRHVRSSSADADADEAHLLAQAAAHVTGPQQLSPHADAVPVSASAPASPRGRKLRSSGSWRHHLPAISSISTSALLWGSAADGSAARPRKSPGVARLESPSSWCGSAGLSWEWDTLAAFCDTEDALGAAAAGGGGGSSLGAGAGSFGAGASHSHSGQRVNSGQRGRGILQDLHSSAAAGAGGPGSVASQASIELPVVVKRPSGVDSLVDALLDPEHSASSQTSNAAAAAAAAAATGRVLAADASSSAVAGHAAGHQPPAQLRKGYSWHGSSSWFAAMAAAAGTSSSSSAATNSGSSGKHGRSHIQPGQQWQAQQGGARAPASAQEWEEEPLGLVAAEASLLDLQPLLLGEAPSAVLSSCDPVQGLLEALNWSADVQRYRAPAQHSSILRSGSSSSSGRPFSRRYSTSSEPGSPRHARGLLPASMSSPVLHSCRSAPATPEQSVAAISSPQDAALSSHSRRTAAQRSVRAGSRGSDSGGSGRRRAGWVSGSDACRLLDLQDWAEDEAEGLDGGEPAAGQAAAAAAAPVKDAARVERGGKLEAAPLHPARQPSADAAAAVDAVGAAARRTQGPGRMRGHAAPAAAPARSRLQGSTDAAGDEPSLLAGEGLPHAAGSRGAPPGVPPLQQWQQLEKAWQKSWWV